MPEPDHVDVADDEEEPTCTQPCHPDSGCEDCAGYWATMIADGYWDRERAQWTNRGWHEITRTI